MRKPNELELMLNKQIIKSCKETTGYEAKELIDVSFALVLPTSLLVTELSARAVAKDNKKNQVEKREHQSDYYVMRLNREKTGFVFVADDDNEPIPFKTRELAEDCADFLCKTTSITNKEIMVVTLHA
jgi:hypothetical protein